MKIAKINYVSFAFCGRKKEIREADSIMRRTKQTFPMTSATYIKHFYIDSFPKQKQEELEYNTNDKTNKEFMGKFWHLNWLVSKTRIQTDCAPDTKIPCKPVLDAVKNYKAGNCYENAVAALAVLCANGYYNSEICTLQYTTEFKNKVTGRIKYSIDKRMDHVIVLTDMNKEGKQNIVIDPWLGISDSKEGAIAKYKSIYPACKLDKLRREAMYDALGCCYFLHEKNYDISSKINFRPSEANMYGITELKKLGRYMRKKYPEVIIR